MQYLSVKANSHFVDVYHYSIDVPLSKSKNDWPNGQKGFDDVEDWLDYVEDTLLRLGITEVQCNSSAPPKNANNAYNFQFFFQSELESLQFRMAIMPDIRGNFAREILSNSSEQSLKRERNISRFIEANEIRAAIHRKDDTTFSVTSAWLHSDLAIALQLIKRTFDKGQYPDRQRSRQIPVLLRAYECS